MGWLVRGKWVVGRTKFMEMKLWILVLVFRVKLFSGEGMDSEWGEKLKRECRREIDFCMCILHR